MPANLVLSHWLEIKKSKQREINLQSYTISHIASFIYNYLKNEDNEDAQPLESKDFLPFQEATSKGHFSTRTGSIFLEKMENGLIPPNILADVKAIDGGNLMKELLELGKRASGRS